MSLRRRMRREGAVNDDADGEEEEYMAGAQ